MSEQFTYSDPTHVKHAKTVNNRVYESSNEEEMGSKTYKIHHSKSSDVINKFDSSSLLKFNQKEIVDNDKRLHLSSIYP